MNKEKLFVFVVAGKKEHIYELNLAVKALKHFTVNEIVILSDLTRNEAVIEHNNVLNVITPKHLTNHQAAIYLKTSLHKFLDMSCDYCYLDGDVLAVRENVDDIFNYFVSPISFCTDHCRLQEFSEAAIHSTFDLDIIKKREKLNSLFKLIDKQDLKSNIGLKSFINRFIRYIVFSFSVVKRGFIYDRINNRWFDINGNTIFQEKSDILVDAIKNKFGVIINVKNWQHWNGGVFLFNSDSLEFMETWHQWTLEIFNDKYWQVRDQGTLVATAWNFGLQNHPTLPVEFNFLADFHHPTMRYKGNLTFGFKSKPDVIKPVFLHIYHHWGDQEWEVWNDVEKSLEL